MLVLQAFVLYLTSMRRCDDSWLVLSCTGVALRIAMSIGLHRDGSTLGLDGFSTEIRRRLWWHLMLLDADLSEAHGVDSVSPPSYNTQMPTNLDDVDIQPGMDTIPKAHIGFTEMTPSLVRYEIMIRSRPLLQQSSDRPSLVGGNGDMSNLDSNVNIISELQESLEKDFSRHCSEAIALQFTTQEILRVKCRMLSFSVYHPFVRDRRASSQNDSQAIRDTLFDIAADIVERVRDLESNPRTCHWGWYFRSDTQWPALVYLLNEVIVRPPSPSVDQAWDVIKHARRQYHAGRLSESQGTHGTRGMLFRPMKELTAKAFVVKDAVIQQAADHSQGEASTTAENCNSGSNRISGLEQTRHPLSSDLRSHGQMTGNGDLWQFDHRLSFQTFWQNPELDASASSFADLTLLATNEGHMLDTLLL